MAPIYSIDPDQLTDLTIPVSQQMTDEDTKIRFALENLNMKTFVISYSQTHFGLPIWGAGISVVIQNNPLRVTSSHSTLHFSVQVDKPDLNTEFWPDLLILFC